MVIKIISNPYQRNLLFQRKNNEGSWSSITLDDNRDGQLLTDDICNGFFPFVANQIVELLLKEYAIADEPFEIEFEGTSDEYMVLESICDEEYKGRIVLYKSPAYLENARDILPEIREIYQEVSPLIESSILNDREALEGEIKKFKEASGEQIPICVLGNYSSGKSTFINALIGSEILTSGDQPVTANIFKISRSPHKDRAVIKYYENGIKAEIRLEDTSFRFYGGDPENDLSTKIQDYLNANKNDEINLKMHTILEMIQPYVRKESGTEIGDLIELTVPFNQGLWQESDNEFVIFDTPGSNTASNLEHVRVLKKAMHDMSDGIPVFIAEKNTLDSTDNEKLYEDIKEVEELDPRFTMIIVNKADNADLEEKEGEVGLSDETVEDIMSQSIPKSMYGDGIYFVSSIIGLGSKTDGKMIDTHYKKTYYQINSSFSDENSPFYTRLYRFNIMPEELKKNMIEEAENCRDLMYANSGLYTIEKEIQTFGQKYSSYNKCFKSEKLLNKIIDITEKEIESTKNSLKEEKRIREESLEKDKKALMEKIKNYQETRKSEFLDQYPEWMGNLIDSLIEETKVIDLNDLKNEYLQTFSEEYDLEQFEEDLNSARKNILSNFSDSVKKITETIAEEMNSEKMVEKAVDFVSDNAEKKPEKETIGKLFDRLKADLEQAQTDSKELRDVKRIIRENADNKLLEKKNNDFLNDSERVVTVLDDQSRQYWNERSISLKEGLEELITGSSELDSDRRKELSDLIISYHDITYDQIDGKAFVAEEFQRKALLGGLLFGDKGVDLLKLRDAYNQRIKDHILECNDKVSRSHTDSFTNWQDTLADLIDKNIIDYNPDLRNTSELIRQDEIKINNLEKRLVKLEEYRKEIGEKMIWKNQEA